MTRPHGRGPWAVSGSREGYSEVKEGVVAAMYVKFEHVHATTQIYVS